MRKSYGFLFQGIVVLVLAFSCSAVAQNQDSVRAKTPGLKKEDDKISLLLYVRVISDANGNVRVDENVVPNFKLNNWLRLEVGFRYGERPQQFGSYYHYKAELRTKYFWKSVRFFARVSDNVIQYPQPVYAKSNYLLVAETKRPLSKSFVVIAGLGYVFTALQDYSQDGFPALNGSTTNSPTFKIALRYLLGDKGFVEGVYGAYDVFNPYPLSSPFLQATFEYDITRTTSLYSYYRYQYNNYVDVPLNNFFNLGVRLHLLR